MLLGSIPRAGLQYEKFVSFEVKQQFIGIRQFTCCLACHYPCRKMNDLINFFLNFTFPNKLSKEHFQNIN